MDNPVARRVLAVVAAVLAVAGLAASAVLAPGLPGEGGTGMPAAAAASTPLPSPAAQVAQRPGAATPQVAKVAQVAFIATLKRIVLYAATPRGAWAGYVPAQNPFGGTTALAVVGSTLGGTWLRVELPVRPNGTTAWIRSAGVSLSETWYRVLVSTEARKLTVMNGNHLVLTTPVAVGKPSTPTPPGHTFLWELIRPDNPYGAYGPYIFGLAWFSDAYSVFNGGDAQIGIHGQDEPWSIGFAVSHGCIRVPNDVITKLAGMLPLGTPVTIS